MKVIFAFIVATTTLVSSCAHRDAYSEKRRENSFRKEGKDTYSAASNRSLPQEGRDSYSASSGKLSWHFWKKWKKKRTDSYSVGRKRKKIKKRNPPQGIKNN